MTAYTDATKIAAYLGVTLTAGQITQAGLAAQAASDWIDEYKGKTWQASSPVTDEQHDLVGDTVYLNNRPVSAVSVVKTRSRYADAPSTTLDASQWELLDAANGVLLILGWANTGSLALVTYTHTASAPPSQIAFSATIIAASLLGPTLRPNSDGLDSVAVGQNDVSVKFSVSYGSVPDKALMLLGARAVVIA